MMENPTEENKLKFNHLLFYYQYLLLLLLLLDLIVIFINAVQEIFHFLTDGYS